MLSRSLEKRFREVASQRLSRVKEALARRHGESFDASDADIAVREIHNLKGEARLVGGYGEVGVLARSAEQLVRFAREREYAVPPETHELLGWALESLDRLLGAPGGVHPEVDVFEFTFRVQSLLAGERTQAPPRPAKEGGAEPGAVPRELSAKLGELLAEALDRAHGEGPHLRIEWSADFAAERLEPLRRGFAERGMTLRAGPSGTGLEIFAARDRRRASVEREAKVLIVDDSELTRDKVAEALRERGFRTQEAENGAVGLERIAKERPDFLILDLEMPVLDGFGVLQQLRIEAGSPPVVVYSSRGGQEDRRRCAELGAAEYVVKGAASVERLAEVVERLAGGGGR